MNRRQILLAAVMLIAASAASAQTRTDLNLNADGAAIKGYDPVANEKWPVLSRQ